MVCGEETAPHAEAVQMADQQGRVNDETATTEVRTGSMQNNAPKNDPDDLEGSGDEEGDRGIVTSDPSMLPEIKKRKKKKNTKSKGKRGIASGSTINFQGHLADRVSKGQTYGHGRVLCRCSSDGRRIRRAADCLQSVSNNKIPCAKPS